MSSETSVQPVPTTAWRAVQIPVRRLLACLGLAWAAAFIAVGTFWQLQLYGDGAVFSFAVAIGESWTVHWHNIVGRSAVLLCCMLPAEGVARWTQSADAGVAVYGLLFFSAPAVGLACTYLCDRSQRQAFFTTACVSTACLSPLVFGFPTEMWIAHAIFWPTLALAHEAPPGRSGFACLLPAMVALVFTHEGAVVLAFALVATTLVRRSRYTFLRSSVTLAIALVLLVIAHLVVTPDDYFTPVLAHARQHFFDLRIFTSGAFALLATALAGYVAALLALRRLGAGQAVAIASALVLAGLAIYWLFLSPALHAENRYCLRTVLVVMTPVLAMVATMLAVRTSDQDWLPAQVTARLRLLLDRSFAVRATVGAILLMTLVHAVETTRFVDAWADYTREVRMLASSTISDPTLGDARFVSSERIDRPLKALAWSSTTPYLSVLLSPGFSPRRLVVDPAAGYFWLSCDFSRSAEARKSQPLPAAGLGLISAYSCLHQRDRQAVFGLIHTSRSR